MVLSAHPDDETIGCGATICKLSTIYKCVVDLIIFSDGVSSRGVATCNNRLYQLEKVIDILGVNEYFYGDFPDNSMDSVPLLSVCKFIEKSIDYFPDIIFTHHPGCLNIDHKIVFDATLTVFRPKSKSHCIYSYFIPSSTDYNPLNGFCGNVYFDISDFVDKKMEALKVYNDEMRDYPSSRSYENIINIMKNNGCEVGIEFAEKFQHIRSVI